MNDFRIIYDEYDIILPDGHNVGVQGEHNAVQLVITIPKWFLCSADFFIVNLNRKMSAIITKEKNAEGGYIEGTTIYQPLTSAYTEERSLSVSVAAFIEKDDGGNEIINCTRTVHGLILSESTLTDDKTNSGIALNVYGLKIFQHTHHNQPTLDRLTEVDGTLYLDGKRLDGVIVWPIQKDPVIPAQPDGTLLYTVYGEDGLVNSDPYLVEMLGGLYSKPAPWKPGQLWVCRGGIWYLLTSEGSKNFDPSEVVQVGDDNLGSIGDEDVYAPAPLPDEDTDTDDVVLMPMGESLHLIAREDFGSAPMYAMESFIRQNDPKYDFYVDGADGTKIRIICNGFDVFEVEVNGTGYEIGAVELPETFTITSVNGYSSIEDLSADMLDAYRTFCSFVNTSTEAMGSGVPKPGKTEIPTRGLMWNRTYVLRLDYDSIEVVFAEDADDGLTTEEAYTTGYVYFPQNLDAAISGVDYFVCGVPQTTQGWHKWIFNRLPNGKISLGALDLEEVTSA